MKTCIAHVYISIYVYKHIHTKNNEDDNYKYHDLSLHMQLFLIMCYYLYKVLDQVWRERLLETSSSTVLMECTLLLEYYINKAWLKTPQNKLLNALPFPHFAVRCSTLSAVALRIYCLDKTMNYDKVVLPSRLSRSSVSTDIKESSSSSSRSVSFIICVLTLLLLFVC
jgi:hypothetical protein